MQKFHLRKLQQQQQTSKYRSGLEERVANQLSNLNVSFDYETEVITYTKPEEKGRYTPDFILPNGIYVETKGQFVTADRKKHKLIRQQYGDKLDIRFVFSNPKARIGKKSKTTYADWCERYGFKYAAKDIPQEWIQERK